MRQASEADFRWSCCPRPRDLEKLLLQSKGRSLGGGPAGTAAAMYLLRQEITPVIIETGCSAVPTTGITDRPRAKWERSEEVTSLLATCAELQRVRNGDCRLLNPCAGGNYVLA
jgi:hypothetical protein